MISFNYETNFKLNDNEIISKWIGATILNEGFKKGDINYIFCDDTYLLKLNVEFLNHNTLTDIISFDYSIGKILHGDIYISIERVKENAIKFGASFDKELNRVIIHGVLHYCGYKDKTEIDIALMRKKENYYLNQLD